MGAQDRRQSPGSHGWVKWVGILGLAVTVAALGYLAAVAPSTPASRQLYVRLVFFALPGCLILFLWPLPVGLRFRLLAGAPLVLLIAIVCSGAQSILSYEDSGWYAYGLACPLAAVWVCLMIVSATVERRHSAVNPEFCRCGYRFAGNVSGACPECGLGLPASADRSLPRTAGNDDTGQCTARDSNPGPAD